MGPRTRARVARGFWWTPWDLETELESPGRAGGPRGTSDNSPSSPGHLVDPRDLGPQRKWPRELVDSAGPRTWAHVARVSWSTLRNPRPFPESPGTACQHHRPSDTGLYCPGQLVNPAGYGAGRESSGTAGLPHGPTTRARVALECWSSTQDLGNGPESPRAAGRHRGPRDTGLSYLGQLVEPAGLRTRARVARDSRSTLRARGHGPELPEMACRPRGPSDTSLNALESCSIPQALEHGPRSHETCGGARGLSEPGASPLGELVNPAGHQAQARSPGRAGQPRGPSEPSTSRQGVLVDTAPPRTRARGAWESWSNVRVIRP